MIHRLMCFLALIFSLEVLGQNLIPNPSFEDTICSWPGYENPFDFPFFSHVKDWFNPNNATPDYYVTSPYQHPGECASNSIYNPGLLAAGEWQYPKEGERMVGLWVGNNLNVTRDFLEAKLLEPLIADTQYCFSMYVSLGNRQNLAIDRIGAFFSMDSVYDHSWAGGFEYDEGMYVTSPAGVFLTDTAEWMRIEGVYTAQGGEEFFLIGNAFDDTETSYLEVDGWGNGWDVAKYFIGDLELVPCSSLSLVEQSLSNVNAWFDANGALALTAPLSSTWSVYDLQGRLLASGETHRESELLQLRTLSRGIYLLQVVKDKAKFSQKLVKR